MRILNIAGMSLIALTHLLFLCFIVQEFCRTLRGKKHRADAPVFEGFDAAEEDEPYIPKLSADALQKLKPGREACFVEQEIFPAVPRMLSFMTMEERGWARMALSAFIGFILEISVEQEKDFTTVLALLENAAVPEAADEVEIRCGSGYGGSQRIVMLFDFCVLPGALPRQAAYLFPLCPDCENALRKSVRVRPPGIYRQPVENGCERRKRSMTQTVSTESPMELSSRERLIQIMKREQALFIRQTLSQKPGYRGGKKAFEYFIRQKIVKAVEAGCGDAEALLRTPKPVKSIYYDFKYYFDEYSYANCDLYVEKAIEDCGNNTLRKEFLRAKGWDAPDDFDINDEEE